jgi:hypothetical protein
MPDESQQDHDNSLKIEGVAPSECGNKTRVTLSLSGIDALRLRQAFEAGMLKELGISAIEFHTEGQPASDSGPWSTKVQGQPSKASDRPNPRK